MVDMETPARSGRTTVELDRNDRNQLARVRAAMELEGGTRLTLGQAIAELARAWLAQRGRQEEAR